MKSITIKTVYLLILLITLPLHSEIRYVSKTGSAQPPYTSWATASDSIQKAINISSFGDTIYVANGVYKERIVMTPGLSLIGSGMDSCVIDTRELLSPPNYVSAVITASYCIFQNFYLRVSDGLTGIGVKNFGVTYTKILNNYIYGSTEGVTVSYSSSFIENNVINGGKGINIAGSIDNKVLVRNNTIYVQENNTGIQISFGTRPTIINNVIYTNHRHAHGIYTGGSDTTKIFNNVVSSKGGYGIPLTNLQTYCYNNLILGYFSAAGFRVGTQNNNFYNNNVSDSEIGVQSSPGNSIIKYNNSWNNSLNYAGLTPDSTNLSIDPMLVDTLDFHLQMYSPLIDAGEPSIFDKDSSRSDIGLYGGPYGESYIYKDYAPKPPKGLNVSADTSYITLTWKKNTEADLRYYRIFRDTTVNFSIDTSKLIGSPSNNILVHSIPHSAKNFYYKITAVDSQENESLVSEEVGIILVSVDDKWHITNDYTLYPNYPNPFNPSTIIPFRLKERGYVKLAVYDIKGELISYLVNEEKEAGYYEVEFNASRIQHQVSSNQNISSRIGYASGIYLYKIDIKNENRIPVFTEVRKMVYIK
ncbi:MAG TPA: right-handed parallel beta-helix repeat-containing protein [Ignavibacteriaceae bacterium]|nr:right-handed parallel beta-helix repeat-containing protein [Ignavibacteriaceae bacterium]